MKEIDGAGGGGQLLRLAVALASLDGTAVKIENIRGSREDPGLAHQHVAAVEAIETLTNATTEGVSLGSETVTFDPGGPLGGSVEVEVGTAGSITLLFDAVLPLALGAKKPITVKASGGTDVKWAPTIGYYQSVKLPVVNSIGLEASVRDIRHGFYPKGGGKANLGIEPSQLQPLQLSNRGSLSRIEIHSIASENLAKADVAPRQITGVKETLADSVSVPVSGESRSVESPSTGTSVLVLAEYEQSLAGFSALGEPGLPAEDVGASAAQKFLEFHAAEGALDEHLADQLLPFVAIAGGRYTTPTITDHLSAAIPILESFGYSITVNTTGESVEIAGQ